MINQVNNFIELNLRILYTTKNSCLNLKDFRAQVGKPFQDPKAFVRLLLIKKLVINPNEDNHCYQLTEFGKEIYENGGWLRHLQRQNKNQSEKSRN